MANLVLVDVGNTRLKWRLVDSSCKTFASVAIGSGEVLTSSVDAQWVKEQSAAWLEFNPQNLVLASVASPRVASILVDHWFEASGQRAFQPSVNHSSLLVTRYQQPTALGIDRWLACLAVAAQTDFEVNVVVGAGTATTIDLVCASSLNELNENHTPWVHMGGLICPGVQTMFDSLAVKGALLPKVSNLIEDPWPSNTNDAIGSGVLRAQVGAVSRQCSEVRERFPQSSSALWFTGGWGEALALASIHMSGYEIKSISDLVMQGLQMAWGESPHV